MHEIICKIKVERKHGNNPDHWWRNLKLQVVYYNHKRPRCFHSSSSSSSSPSSWSMHLFFPSPSSLETLKSDHQKSPNRTKNPMIISHTMCTKSNACADSGAVPPLLPTSQNPIFATFTPLHLASAHPHQYVTPSTPQTGSVVKHFTGHEDVDAGFVMASQTSAAASELTAEMLSRATIVITDRIRKGDEKRGNGAINIIMKVKKEEWEWWWWWWCRRRKRIVEWKEKKRFKKERRALGNFPGGKKRI